VRQRVVIARLSPSVPPEFAVRKFLSEAGKVDGGRRRPRRSLPELEVQVRSGRSYLIRLAVRALKRAGVVATVDLGGGDRLLTFVERRQGDGTVPQQA